jgi:hypothetical protein
MTMKSIIVIIFCLALTLLMGTCAKNKTNESTSTSLEAGFIAPSDTMQTSVFWYWISDNISEEGVVKDLYSMKEAGINRAFIGNIGLSDVPYGKVKMLSEEWWKILHAALKTATELNIEIGIFNSPGWSQSGGPWVSAAEAMRYLISSETRVSGPKKFSQKLTKPKEIFQDVKLIAYPATLDDQLVLNNQNSKIASLPKIGGLTKILDGDTATGVTFPDGDIFTFDIQAKDVFTARSLSIQTIDVPMKTKVLLQAKSKEGEYATIKETAYLLYTCNCFSLSIRALRGTGEVTTDC